MEKKLTTEQIAYIDETLVLNGLNFDDLKIEATRAPIVFKNQQRGDTNLSC